MDINEVLGTLAVLDAGSWRGIELEIEIIAGAAGVLGVARCARGTGQMAISADTLIHACCVGDRLGDLIRCACTHAGSVTEDESG